MVLPYVSSASEDIRRVGGRYNLRVVFRSGRTLHSMLTRVKDTLPLGKHFNVVYQIPCGGCSKVYIGETIRRLETRLKEHHEALRRGMTEKSAVAEHAWDNQHSINWEETSIIDQARRHKELLLKKALHTHMTPADQRINWDEGLELPGCWTATLKRLGGGADNSRPATSGHVYP